MKKGLSRLRIGSLYAASAWSRIDVLTVVTSNSTAKGCLFGRPNAPASPAGAAVSRRQVQASVRPLRPLVHQSLEGASPVTRSRTRPQALRDCLTREDSRDRRSIGLSPSLAAGCIRRIDSPTAQPSSNHARVNSCERHSSLCDQIACWRDAAAPRHPHSCSSSPFRDLLLEHPDLSLQIANATLNNLLPNLRSRRIAERS